LEGSLAAKWRHGRWGRHGVKESRRFEAASNRYSTGFFDCVPTRLRPSGSPLAMNLPNRGHPERSEGSFATGAQSKDPVSFTMDVPLQFHGILRLRYARLSASAPLPMNLPEFAQAGRPFALTAGTAVFRRSHARRGKTARPVCQGRRASRLSHRFIPHQKSRPRVTPLRMTRPLVRNYNSISTCVPPLPSFTGTFFVFDPARTSTT